VLYSVFIFSLIKIFAVLPLPLYSRGGGAYFPRYVYAHEVPCGPRQQESVYWKILRPRGEISADVTYLEGKYEKGKRKG
jgi:hypothetical protein